MTIRVALKHYTRYNYDRPITLAPHIIRLRPAPHSRTPIPSYSIKVEPAEHFVNWQQDPFGNHLARYVFPEKTRTFSISVELIADLIAINPFDFFLEEEAEHFPFDYGLQLSRDLGLNLFRRENRHGVSPDRGWKPGWPGWIPHQASTLSTSWWESISVCSGISPTWCGWRQGFRVRRRPSSAAPGPAVTAPG